MGKEAALERELERYKKALTVRNELIMELREAIAGHYEVQNILSAYISLLAGNGEVRVSKAALKEAIGRIHVQVETVGEEYVIKTTEKEKGEEEK